MVYLKRIIAVILCISMLLCLFACGKDETPNTDNEQQQDQGVKEEDFNPYPYSDLSVFMDLPDYKNVSISQETLDNLINTAIQKLVDANGLYVQVFDRKVEDGDKVTIDFVGMLDDVAFEGGTASDYPLVIGSNSFIDGFEDGIIGMEIGDVKDLYLKFPDTYHNADLAGKDVVFTVTLDEIWGVPEITDEFCQANTIYQTSEEYLRTLKVDCIFNHVYEMLLQQCKIKAYPDEYTEYYQSFVNYFNSLANQYSVTLAEFLSSYGYYFSNYGLYNGMTTNEFYRVAGNYAESNLANDLLTYSLLRAEGITIGSEAYETAKARLENEYGMTYEELTTNYESASVIIGILNIALANRLAEYVKVD